MEFKRNHHKKLYVVHPDMIITRNYSVPNTRPKFVKDKNDEYHDDCSDSEIANNNTNNTTPQARTQPSSALDLDSNTTSGSKRRIQPYRACKQPA